MRFALTVLFLFSITLASAHEPENKCLNINDDAERLACYDKGGWVSTGSFDDNKSPQKPLSKSQRLFDEIWPQLKNRGNKRFGYWLYQENKSSLNDKTSYNIMLMADEQTSCQATREHLMIIGCNPSTYNRHDRYIAFSFGQCNQSAFRHDHAATIDYRIDKNEASNLRFASNDTGTMLFNKSVFVNKMIEDMQKSGRLYVEQKTTGRKLLTSTFNLEKLTEAYSQLEKVCKW